MWKVLDFLMIPAVDDGPEVMVIELSSLLCFWELLTKVTTFRRGQVDVQSDLSSVRLLFSPVIVEFTVSDFGISFPSTTDAKAAGATRFSGLRALGRVCLPSRKANFSSE